MMVLARHVHRLLVAQPHDSVKRVSRPPQPQPPAMSRSTSFESAGEVSLRGTESFWVDSQVADARYEVRVAEPTPGPMSAPITELTVLYVLDGDLFFGMATEMTRLQHMLWGELPPLLVVGIGYGTNDPAVQGETRNRDFTPTNDEAFLEMGRKMRPGWEPLLPEGRRMGGADRFLDFIGQELRPWLADRYPVGSNSVLFGSSMGGLCATHALLTRPHTFWGYVIASPALWWDSELLFRSEATRAETHDDLEAHAFFAAGSLEEGAGIPGLDQWKMVTNPTRMVKALQDRNYASLDVGMHVLEGETHTSVVPVALTRGLRALFR